MSKCVYLDPSPPKSNKIIQYNFKMTYIVSVIINRTTTYIHTYYGRYKHSPTHVQWLSSQHIYYLLAYLVTTMIVYLHCLNLSMCLLYFMFFTLRVHIANITKLNSHQYTRSRINQFTNLTRCLLIGGGSTTNNI